MRRAAKTVGIDIRQLRLEKQQLRGRMRAACGDLVPGGKQHGNIWQILVARVQAGVDDARQARWSCG